MNRKIFLKTAAAGLGGAFLSAYLPGSLKAATRRLNIPLGFQSWVIKEALANDFSGTLKSMAAQGFRMVEMCSPKGYKNMGFGPLASMKGSDMRNIITDAGLTCPSCHYTFTELSAENLDDRIEFAKKLGVRHMICSHPGLSKTATLDEYLVRADDLNQAGEKIKKAGLQLGYHNHSTEFAVLEGRLIYDALLERLDPALVKMQFQTEVINLGYKAADYFNRHPGRFFSAHLSDWTADKKEMPVGKGIIDWKEFFAAAKKAGVETFFVEMTPGTFKESVRYIRSR
ncbi:MAG TPA: sugar phosphate isomerase/epimerase family protein [Pedobacter sp.]|jgi:sugar phosphate isomerase/epimerase